MRTDDTLFMIAAILGLVMAIVGMKYWYTHMARTGDWIEHHVPLGDNARNARLEAAMRDAEQGFNVCSTCGLENVQYRIFCVLCGSPVEKVDSGMNEEGAGPNEALLPKVVSPARQTLRQRRARTRREWARTLDESGNVMWQRAGGVTKNGETALAAYVVEFKYDGVVVDMDNAVQVEEEPLEEDHEEAAAEGDQDALDLQSPTATCKMLEEHVGEFKMTIVEATASQSVVPEFALGRNHVSPIDIKEVIAMASQPFPERLSAFVTHTTMRQADFGTLSLKIKRAKLLSDSMELLAAIPSEISASNIRLRFLKEEGIDAGGVYREWFLLLNEAIVTPEAGVFTCVDAQNQTFYLNPQSREILGETHLVRFLAVGRLLGRALLEGNVTGFHLAQPLLKIILGQPIGFSDLEFYDPVAYKNLKWLVDNNGADALGLTFATMEKLPSGETRTVELVPNGSNVDVTDANKLEFIDRKLRYLLFQSVSDQLFALLKGIYEVVPVELLMLFDAEELDYVLSGSDVIDVDDWETHSKFTADLIDHPVREWFWEIVRGMPNESRSRLLQFATGASRVPLAGFSALTSYDGRLCPFTLKGVALKEGGYIHSHACFNRLDLPRYKAKEQLELMLIGVLDAQIRGFTIA